jgi:hypothetical protein
MDNGLYFCAKLGEIGGENGGGNDEVFGHFGRVGIFRFFVF